MLQILKFSPLRFAGRNFCRGLSTEALDKQKRVNVDEKDVAHLSSFDQDWWHPNGSLKALHSMNLLRVPFVRDGLLSTGKVNESLIGKSNVLEGLKLLDVGCGGGILSEALAKLKVCSISLKLCKNNYYYIFSTLG